MKLIGLTGGVASGKSTVAEIALKHGFAVIDTDRIAHELLANHDDVGKKVQKEFGTKDRKKLRQIIFKNAAQRHALEKILHPLIGEEVDRQIKTLRDASQPSKGIIVIVPLLFEAGWEKRFDQTIAVVCSQENQLKRLMKRDGIDRDLALKMVATQLPMTDKSERADHVLSNDAGTLELTQATETLLDAIR